MRTVLRVGAIFGLFGGLLSYATARYAAFTVTGVIMLVGIFAGLAVAKWLQWGWYGRQLDASLKAVGAAIVLCAGGALVGFFGGPHHAVTALAAQSHLGPLSFERLAGSLAFAGPIAGPVFGVLLASALGLSLGVLATVVFAWNKNAQAVQLVTRARLSAHALRRGDESAPLPAIPSSITAGPAWQALTGAPPAAQIPSGPLYMTGAPVPGAPTAGDTPLIDAHPPVEAMRDWRTLPPVPSMSADQPSASATRRRKKVDVGPVELGTLAETGVHPMADDAKLKDAMREAMAMWSTDEKSEWTNEGQPVEAEVDEQPTQQRPREAVESEFLNSGNTFKGKARKKNDTRDWLC